MKPEQQLRLSRTGPGTDGGALLHRLWTPVARLDELAPAGSGYPVQPLRVPGQDLLLFRDALGRRGLLDRACRHRGADPALGRRVVDGLRCALHSWKFDIDGRRAAGRCGQRAGGHRMPGAGVRLAAPMPASSAGAARATGLAVGMSGARARPGAHVAVTRSA